MCDEDAKHHRDDILHVRNRTPWALSQTLIDTFPVLGSLISTYAYFKLKKTGVQIAIIVLNLFWVPVMLYYGAYISAAHYSAIMLSAAYVLHRDVFVTEAAEQQA